MFGMRRSEVVETPVSYKPVGVVVPEAQPILDGRNTTVVQEVPVVTSIPSRWDQFRSGLSARVQGIVTFAFTLVALLIVVRFALLALAANLAAPFAAFIMEWSQPLVAPFIHLFGRLALSSFPLFELADVVALFVYAVVTALLCGLVSLILTPYVPDVRVLPTRR